MVGLLDTTILVDFVRQHQPAMAWLEAQDDLLGITPMVYMELIAGAQNKANQRIALDLLSDFDLVFPAEADMKWAIQYHLKFVLSHNVGIVDCLIASVSARLKLPLYTNNLKHFSPLLGDLVQKPY